MYYVKSMGLYLGRPSHIDLEEGRNWAGPLHLPVGHVLAIAWLPC
jgi:hypothetical protein